MEGAPPGTAVLGVDVWREVVVQQLAATVSDTVRQARRSLDAARLAGDAAQVELHLARLTYLAELASEYGIKVSCLSSRAAMAR